MCIDTFNVIVVDQDIHKVDAVKAEGSALFWFSEDIGPHYFCRAVSYFQVFINNFVFNEEVSTFDMFCSFGAQEGSIEFNPHGGQVILEWNVLFYGVSLGLDKVSCMEDWR